MADESSSSSIKKKKLPFKPTALRRIVAPTPDASSKNDEQSDDDGLALFRQAKSMEPIMAADRERRLRKRQKQQEEERRRASITAGKRPMEDDDTEGTPPPLSDPAAEDHNGLETEDIRETPLDESMAVAGDGFSRELVTPPSSKRSRLGSEQGSRSSKRNRTNVDDSADPFDDSPSKRSHRSPTKLSTPSKTPRKEITTSISLPVISLDSDSEDDIKPIAVEATVRHREDSIEFVGPGETDHDSTGIIPAPVEVEDEDEEDEFDEYVRRAAEQRARENAMLNTDSEGASTKEAADIMITSNIPGSKVAYVKYLFNKPLRLVRDSWIALQRRKSVPLPITVDDDIILTWQKKKVYTSSTLFNLGIRPQGDGKIIADEYSKGGLVNGRTKIHMEAWTIEDFRKMELEEDLRQKREAGEISDDDLPEEPAEPETRLRIKLRAKDMEEVKLSVLLETTVETLVTGFRAQRDIAADQDIGIYFDGDRLEEHQTMESAEIYDMDTLEVHIK